jgi:trehalose 6-phosphate synthase
LLVNPYDPDAVSASIRRALSMPLEERRARQSALMQALTANDIQDWPDKFLAALTGNGASAVPRERLVRPMQAIGRVPHH